MVVIDCKTVFAHAEYAVKTVVKIITMQSENSQGCSQHTVRIREPYERLVNAYVVFFYVIT